MDKIELLNELQKLVGIVKPIVAETVEHWSNGEDCYQSALDHINQLETRINIQ
jgi:hypothetical protein